LGDGVGVGVGDLDGDGLEVAVGVAVGVGDTVGFVASRVVGLSTGRTRFSDVDFSDGRSTGVDGWLLGGGGSSVGASGGVGSIARVSLGTGVSPLMLLSATAPAPAPTTSAAARAATRPPLRGVLGARRPCRGPASVVASAACTAPV